MTRRFHPQPRTGTARTVCLLAGCLAAAAAVCSDVPAFVQRPRSYPDGEPGFGYPGRLFPFPASAETQAKLARYGLAAAVFRRAPVDPAKHAIPPAICPGELTFVHFTPQRVTRPLPLILFISGAGERGDDPTVLLRQSALFSKVTGPDFQEKRACHLFVPLIPQGMQLRSTTKGVPHPLAALVCDALYAAIDAASVPVDTNRLYVTGFSYGGNMAFDFPCVYPGRFAASVPVASLQRIGMIPETNPGRYWVLYNEGDFQRYNGDARVAELRDLVVARGGEFRIGSFPADGHNAWDAAWREDRVWDWMFSKTADGRPVREGRVVARRPEMAAPTTANATRVDAPVTPTAPQRPVCGASRPGQDAKTGPERGADGLDGTWYASGTPMEGNRRDWWTVAYPTPVTGRITVTTGDKTGKGKLSKGDVEVSLDGERWTRVRSFSDGVCSFAQKRPIRHLRVMPLPKTPEVLVIREVTVEP